MGDTVLYHVRERIAVITLNRPEALNAINRQLRKDLDETILRFDRDDNAWVGIITGAGRAFCAGRDLKERTRDNLEGRKAKGTDSLMPDRLSMHPTTWKPLIAAVNGYAMAGGWSIAQMCDLRIAAEGAKLGISEPRVGLLPPFAVQLNRQIPQAAVMELVMTGEPIHAKRLVEMGFLNQVTPAEDLMKTAINLAQTILKNAPLSIRTFKRLVFQSRDITEPEAAAMTIQAYDQLLQSEDAKEGPRAFAEKREPQWKAR
ncbi:enoyl-CoA hydratase/isomerase family protein [Thermodesulfobacteriota bacterium]